MAMLLRLNEPSTIRDEPERFFGNICFGLRLEVERVELLFW